MSKVKNIEIKAVCNQPDRIRGILNQLKAEFRGIDHQVDTYFKNQNGRLKLREGNIENNLIYYERHDQAGPKKSDCALFKTSSATGLKEILSKALDVKVIVDKTREIYFIDHVKFHIDKVKDLGDFVEIEVIDESGMANEKEMLKTCRKYMTLLAVNETDLVEHSYSDLLSDKVKTIV